MVILAIVTKIKVENKGREWHYDLGHSEGLFYFYLVLGL